jgi:CheY-like chemotaxis protein
VSVAKILIVEDEAIIALDLQRIVEGLGHEVIGRLPEASRAIEVAVAEKPDLVLLDVVLEGGMSGIEAAAAIHQRLTSPVIFLNANSREAQRDRAQLPGVAGCLRKPFSKGEVAAAIENALGRRRDDTPGTEPEIPVQPGQPRS